jgi:predicted transglutaminase-like cysteine proteinase
MSVTTLEKTLPIRHFHIRQERLASNGVLVSRPRPLDLKIMSLIDMNDIQTLKDYAQWLNNHIRYQKDMQKDIWSSPEETLQKKTADCEDFTFLTAAVLQVLGYQPRFIALMSKRQGHAICVFKANNYYAWFDNAQLVETEAKTVEELIPLIQKRYRYNKILELNLETKAWSALAQNL